MKSQEIRKMNKKDRESKMKELKVELVKAKASATKSGNSKIKQIKKIMARMLTINHQENTELKNK